MGEYPGKTSPNVFPPGLTISEKNKQTKSGLKNYHHQLMMSLQFKFILFYFYSAPLKISKSINISLQLRSASQHKINASSPSVCSAATSSSRHLFLTLSVVTGGGGKEVTRGGGGGGGGGGGSSGSSGGGGRGRGLSWLLTAEQERDKQDSTPIKGTFHFKSSTVIKEASNAKSHCSEVYL